ncbi:hypothetical protein O7606_11935 [Micromonospora sp. WMMD882]|uniref:hypothetical protein n=1 Tax=Micromonospora sp. WMMD882 TaxID=3015151 RepID=UPI00248C44E9|nr:hypothetical protein [Micromonospora sp. WMMD882]WBB82004.1 hypothetical protein O7606_11935 [Micromonospora sp. WMMD882]
MAKLFSRKALTVTFAVLGLTLAGGGIAAAQPDAGSAPAADRVGQAVGQPQISPEDARAARQAMRAGPSANAVPGSVSFAVVNANGTLARGWDAVSVTKYGAGQYQVVFNHDVSRSGYVATIGIAVDCCIPPSGEIGVAPRLATPNGVFVQTRNSAGSPADRGFHLVVADPVVTAPPLAPPTSPGNPQG